MSDQDVEVVREAMLAFNEGDVAAVLRALDPQVEFAPVRAVLEGTAYKGHEGFRRFLADMEEDWEQYHPEPDEFRDLGEGRVLVLGRFCARGRASGMEVETPGAWLNDLSDGRIVRMRFFASEQAALESVGLSG